MLRSATALYAKAERENEMLNASQAPTDPQSGGVVMPRPCHNAVRLARMEGSFA
jgi:hypothetical protein